MEKDLVKTCRNIQKALELKMERINYTEETPLQFIVTLSQLTLMHTGQRAGFFGELDEEEVLVREIEPIRSEKFTNIYEADKVYTAIEKSYIQSRIMRG